MQSDAGWREHGPMDASMPCEVDLVHRVALRGRSRASRRSGASDGQPPLAIALLLVCASLVGHAAPADAQSGRVRFLDDAHCYYVSPYFKRNVRASVRLLRNGATVQGPFELGRFATYGNYPGKPGHHDTVTARAG